ncbi:MAG: YtxH domain-containing protein [Leptolyngbyaceae bacterium]|nr:YtxH domain-containing protein [Leptolyngbyaceae bacterium]
MVDSGAKTGTYRGVKASERQSDEGNQAQAGVFVGGMIVGAAVGAAAGAIAGLLSAPHDGKATRTLLKQSVDELPQLTRDVATSMQFQGQRLVKTSFNGWERTLLRLRTAISTGIAVSQQERQRLAQKGQSFSSPAQPTNTNAKS